MFKKDLNSKIGSRIRFIRESQRKTREQIAEIAEISPQFLFEIETGKKGMTSQTIISLAQALNVSTDFILMGHDSTRTRIVNSLEGLPADQLNIAEKFIETFSVGAMQKYNEKVKQKAREEAR